MKWGRKKPSSPSSSFRPSSMSRVFPVSWFSKFKQMGGSSKQSGKKNSPSLGSWQHVNYSDGRFYRTDDNGFWRLSFGEEEEEEEEDVMKRRDRSVLRSVLYDSDDELEPPLSSCRSCRSCTTKMEERGESQKFNDMVSDIRRMRELHGDVEISDAWKGEKGRRETKLKLPRKEITKIQELQRGRRRSNFWSELDAEAKSTKSAGVSGIQTINRDRDDGKLTTSTPDRRKHRYRYASSMNPKGFSLGTIEEDCTSKPGGVGKEEDSSEWEKLKVMKIKRLMSKSEKQRKSMYINRELQGSPRQRSKIRIQSPRTPSKAEICKIKAVEDMKARMKMKKKTKDRLVEGRTELESFAVVKCSFDPQKDFRDSMIEMIMEKRISQPEKLEELLACYLTLNSDEYHDLIIKVFRQVWFDLNQACFAHDLQNLTLL